jgi:hypothetical protein
MDTVQTSSSPSGLSLSGLPLELIIDVFKCLASLADVKALLSVNSTFNSIWKGNIKVVAESILPGFIPCYDDARVLRDVQILGKAIILQLSTYDSVIENLCMFVENSRSAEYAIDEFAAYLDPTVFPDPIEKPRFIRTYYRLWIFVEFHYCQDGDRLRKEFLAYSTITEKYRLRFLAGWLFESRPSPTTEDLHNGAQVAAWRGGVNELILHWRDLKARWLTEEGFRDRLGGRFPLPSCFKNHYLGPPSNKRKGVDFVRFHVDCNDLGGT